FNTAMSGYVEDIESRVVNKGPKALFEITTKSNNPFCQGLDVKPGALLQTHTAMFRISDGETRRVKVKYDWIDKKTLLAWIEPFSEDVALTQAHSDFVSVVSHEFRTPLTSIKGFADTLLRYSGNIDRDQQARFINIIKHQADRLSRLVENLLTVSKLGAQRTSFIYRSITVRKVIDNIVQSIQGKLSEPREFALDFSDNMPTAWADPDKFEQILLNLIDNAVKYSFPETTVRIKAQPYPENDDMVQISITNEGVGIPSDNLKNLFNQFYRVDNTLTRDVEGTGLGLYITKSLTKAMGGDIMVDSEVNKETTFSVIFPITTPERQAAAVREAEGVLSE
ncbi:MAG: HAMP domain-containing histidine kinase, partial [Cyanobacteria bacterium HKST-UBA05]|nr:HAMP domain-containing histidine kinase [Cyanobacteria bacterium HKST-UBA05]